jgi:hypothetical protein
MVMTGQEVADGGREIKLSYLDYINISQVKFKICTDCCENVQVEGKWERKHIDNCLTLQDIMAKLAF